MINVGANYKEGGRVKNPTCPVCQIKTEYDSQLHLMLCQALNVNLVVGTKIPKYDDLFGKNLENRILVAQFLQRNYQKRNKLLKQNKET